MALAKRLVALEQAKGGAPKPLPELDLPSDTVERIAAAHASGGLETLATADLEAIVAAYDKESPNRCPYARG